MGAPHGGLKHLRVYVVLRYILHLAVTERCVKAYPTIRITDGAPDFADAPAACFDKPCGTM